MPGHSAIIRKINGIGKIFCVRLALESEKPARGSRLIGYQTQGVMVTPLDQDIITSPRISCQNFLERILDQDALEYATPKLATRESMS